MLIITNCTFVDIRMEPWTNFKLCLEKTLHAKNAMWSNQSLRWRMVWEFEGQKDCLEKDKAVDKMKIELFYHEICKTVAKNFPDLQLAHNYGGDYTTKSKQLALQPAISSVHHALMKFTMHP